MKTSILFISTLLMFVCVACETHKAEEKKDANVITVKGVSVRSLQPSKKITLPGELHSWNKVSIYPRVKGFIKTLHVDRGSLVRKGQVLAIVEAPELLSELDQATGQFRAAEAVYLESKARSSASGYAYARLLKASSSKGTVSQHELELAESRMLIDSSAVITAQGNLLAAKSHLNTKAEFVKYLTITAPFDGVIIERNISPGALIGGTEGSAKPLFVLEDNSRLRLTLAIPESYSNALNKKTDVDFSVNAAPDKLFHAHFGRSAESILEKTRTMMVEFDIDNKNGELKNGMYAEVILPISRSSKTLFVPKSAVVSTSEAIFVIRSNDKKAEWVRVQKGIVLDSLVEVFGEIKQDDLIVKEASEEIREGDLLKIN